MNIRPNSLRFRLLASTALVVALVLPITAFALTSYYRNAVEQTFDQRLKVHLDNLVAVSLRQNIDADGREKRRPTKRDNQNAEREAVDSEKDRSRERKQIELGEPLFKRPFSGWYWQISIYDGQQQSTVISDSLLDERLILLPDNLAGNAQSKLKRGYVAGPEGQVLRVVEQVIIAEGEETGERGARFTYAVAIRSSELDGQVAQFRNMLLLALGLLGCGLILAGFTQVRYGLAPLFIISRKLNDIRAGKVDHLRGSFPAEIEPLQIELNALIHSNRDIVERARTHVGNLAHALKTPLSVISNEIDKAKQQAAHEQAHTQETALALGDLATKIDMQTQIMNDQVRHHLDRARMAAQAGIIGNSTSIRPVMLSLARTLQKIYHEKEVEMRCECQQDLLFRGEKQDLEEMLGNLLDNAFKWAKSEVILSAVPSAKKSGYMTIRVDDDGPGLGENERARAIKRGQRLDENLPGSGLGLSIVADLAHLYEGAFVLEASKKGGLRAELLLPVADAQ